MIGLLVAHGYEDHLAARWSTFAGALGIPAERRVVVDNRGGDLADVAGSNEQFEFSGYLEGLRFALEHHPDLDRLVVVNDTLFNHHWSAGWRRIAGAPGRAPGIWGDGRNNRAPASDRRLRYLASWHFDLVGAAAIRAFEASLVSVIARFDEIDADAAYEAYLDHYLRGSATRGYSNPSAMRDDAARIRKLACIRAEHRLSADVSVARLMRPYGGATYRLVHAIDRLLSARRRIALQ